MTYRISVAWVQCVLWSKTTGLLISVMQYHNHFNSKESPCELSFFYLTQQKQQQTKSGCMTGKFHCFNYKKLHYQMQRKIPSNETIIDFWCVRTALPPLHLINLLWFCHLRDLHLSDPFHSFCSILVQQEPHEISLPWVSSLPRKVGQGTDFSDVTVDVMVIH